MITPFEIYLIGLMDGVGGVLTTIGAVSLTFFILSGVFWFIAYSAENEKAAKVLKIVCEKSFCCLLFFGIIGSILPSSKTLTAMYIIPPVVKAVNDNKQMQQIPQAVLDLIKSYERKDEDKDKD